MVLKESIRIALTHTALPCMTSLSMLLTSRMLTYLLLRQRNTTLCADLNLAMITLDGMLSSHVRSTVGVGRQPDVTRLFLCKFMHDKLGLIN